MRKFLSVVALWAGLAVWASPLAAQSTPDPEAHQWWQRAVVYEIYPRSFADSNNDGVGDLEGITSKLDYLKQLGIDAIWITPCFPSPQVDFGYDVSNYENIDPMYGTLQDFDRLVSEGRKKRHSHHSGFRDEPYLRSAPMVHRFALFANVGAPRLVRLARWYPATAGCPTTGLALFGGSAWKLDATDRAVLLPLLLSQQPDLNWRNPAVEKAMFDITRWWYKRGVAGFRLDAVDTLFEDPDLRDNPVLPGVKKPTATPTRSRSTTCKLPEVHDVLRGLRRVADASTRRPDRRNLDHEHRRVEGLLRRPQ